MGLYLPCRWLRRLLQPTELFGGLTITVVLASIASEVISEIAALVRVLFVLPIAARYAVLSHARGA